MAASSLEEIVSCQQLPSLPMVAVQVIELSADPTVQIPAIAEVIQNDQALTAKILKTVNSSFYGLSDPCETISRAVTHLGLNTIKSLVLGFSLVRLGRAEHRSEALLKHWRRTVNSAAASRRLAQELGHCDPEDAFISALMQDIGSLAMLTVMREEYAQLVEESGCDHFRLPLIERRELGFDHAAVGALLGERWGLPRSLVQIIRHHHNPQHAPNHHLLQTITLGTQIAEIIGAAGSESECEAMLERFTWCGTNWYNINPLATGELVRRISDDAAELAERLEIDIGKWPDTDAIMARAEEVSLMHQLRVQQETERLRQQNSTLSRMARTCGLTGLANRRSFDEELHAGVHHAINTNSSLAVIFIDVDYFKQLNDSFGHQAGDLTLIEIANRISACLPEDGLACRYGGEEFVIMLPGRGRIDAARIAEAIRAKVGESAVHLRSAGCEQNSVAVTVSAGVAAIEENTKGMLNNSILLIKAADRALYHAKLSGRNQVQVFVPRQQQQMPGAA